MPNWCRVHGAAVGDKAEQVCAVNTRKVLVPNTDPPEYLFESTSPDVDGNKDYLLLDRDGFEAGEYEGNPAFVVSGERKWGPPTELISEWSREFQDLTFYLRYSVQGLWNAGTLMFRNGEVEFVEHVVGWFRTMLTQPYDAPVHHYVVAFKDEPGVVEQVQRLAACGRIFRTETTDRFHSPWLGDVWAFRGDPEDLLKEGVQFAYEPIAYTVDEHTFKESIIDNALYAARRSLQVSECPIELTCEEEQFLRDATPVGTISSDPKGEAERAMRPRLQELDIFATRDQLALLLTSDQLTQDRRDQIKAAMERPLWTKEWPEWKEEMTPAASSEEKGVDHLIKLE
jgi:hypothetical protein